MLLQPSRDDELGSPLTLWWLVRSLVNIPPWLTGETDRRTTVGCVGVGLRLDCNYVVKARRCCGICSGRLGTERPAARPGKDTNGLTCRVARTRGLSRGTQPNQVTGQQVIQICSRDVFI